MSMSSTLQGFSDGEVKLVFGMIEKLSASHDQDALRKDIAKDFLRSSNQTLSPLLSGMQADKCLRMNSSFTLRRSLLSNQDARR